MAAEEYNAFFYTLVSTVSPQANILHRRLILIRHLAFSFNTVEALLATTLVSDQL